MEKIGTNNKKKTAKLDLIRPYELIAKFSDFCAARLRHPPAGALNICSKIKKCSDWSQLLNEARTFYEENPNENF
ncbi:MAG: hypothetical protein PHU42_02365 [Patescibacteria group bacterium]|nr:hypothetical protein [Patescibacteria group bacterium]